MAADDPYEKPVTIGVEPVFFLEGTAIVPPPGTMPPPRPAGMERKPLPPDAVRGWEYVELGGTAVAPPPGTKAPPRPGGRVVRIALPMAEPAAELVADLLQRVQLAIDGLDTDPAKLEALRQAAAALPKAG